MDFKVGQFVLTTTRFTVGRYRCNPRLVKSFTTVLSKCLCHFDKGFVHYFPYLSISMVPLLRSIIMKD